MKNSKIEWCDHTFNPWIGCTKVSPGCLHCYAESLNLRWRKGANWGKGATRERTSEAYWKEPLQWNKAAGESALYETTPEGLKKIRPRVFCASLADWLDGEVSIEWLVDLLALIHRCNNLNWLLLTKRPENWKPRLAFALNNLTTSQQASPENFRFIQWIEAWLNGTPPENVWVGTSVEDQARVNLRVPELLMIPARVRFLSIEPMLGPIDLMKWFHPNGRCGECLDLIRVGREYVSCQCCCEGPEQTLTRTDLIDWVICGGESGPGARPMHPDWARSLRDQCQAAGVPFFFKQWGEWIPWYRGLEIGNRQQAFVMANASRYIPENFSSPLVTMICVGKKQAGRLLDGVEWNEFPV